MTSSEKYDHFPSLESYFKYLKERRLRRNSVKEYKAIEKARYWFGDRVL